MTFAKSIFPTWQWECETWAQLIQCADEQKNPGDNFAVLFVKAHPTGVKDVKVSRGWNYSTQFLPSEHSAHEPPQKGVSLVKIPSN